ncbi:hypothetical protein, conserved [Leishmania tarentolae]|uniref:Uncharacterized protein n=1 Tax=Leishmania tarentolae TaxID=5689 RepID=A0A640KKM5_LEITA|nr:hypothetical protein, conserved [Leishmania tarentolae]
MFIITFTRKMPHNSNNRETPSCSGEILSRRDLSDAGFCSPISKVGVDSREPCTTEVIIPPIEVDRDGVSGTSTGSMRAACAGELICSRVYMERGMAVLPKTRRPSIFAISAVRQGKGAVT